ncbi:conserved Plasmodium protein, unknown function [Plasmodium gallinaceum]|uniref:Fam-c protein n=1 Tax=Plasmodium gallinaceum TaxID=5849 RepID=A0A1J1GWJ3_PLAGA|nr:conserved Plasmodium protein, unknown function [Plasmodium gallinaceum]CRG96631.1 conserved Plasmodium protein, unknown function [Plasmodium gallinaceum]
MKKINKIVFLIFVSFFIIDQKFSEGFLSDSKDFYDINKSSSSRNISKYGQLRKEKEDKNNLRKNNNASDPCDFEICFEIKKEEQIGVSDKCSRKKCYLHKATLIKNKSVTNLEPHELYGEVENSDISKRWRDGNFSNKKNDYKFEGNNNSDKETGISEENGGTDDDEHGQSWEEFNFDSWDPSNNEYKHNSNSNSNTNSNSNYFLHKFNSSPVYNKSDKLNEVHLMKEKYCTRFTNSDEKNNKEISIYDNIFEMHHKPKCHNYYELKCSCFDESGKAKTEDFVIYINPIYKSKKEEEEIKEHEKSKSNYYEKNIVFMNEIINKLRYYNF